MLQTIREYTQGWIAGVIISLVILSFALWGIHSYMVNSGTSSVVAEVNGVEISKEQLSLSYERMRRQAQVQYGANNSSKEDAVLKHKALESLIDIQVLRQASVQQGFQVSNAQVDNYLQSMPEFQVEGQFSVTRFQEILSATMMSISDFLELIKTSLLIEQVRLGVILSSFALPNETINTMSLVNEERDIAYLTIPMSHFANQAINIPAEKIAAYYEQHKKDFMTPEQVMVEYLQLSPSNLTSSFNPSDAVLNTFYNENINAYTQPTSWKLEDIFVPVAESASSDDVKKAEEKAKSIVTQWQKEKDTKKVNISGESKNLLNQGMLTLNQVPAELQKTVANMNAANQVSAPIRTSDGFVILKVVAFAAPTTQAFSVVKDKVRETYIRQHAEDKFSQMRDRLADLTYEHPESLQLAAKTLNLPIQTSELFTRGKAGKDISQYKKVRDMAFSNDVLSLNNNSDVIQLNPETVIVLRVKSHIPSSLLPLANVSPQIEEKLKAAEMESLAVKLADTLLAKLKAGQDATAVAASQGLTWQQAGFTGRYSTKVDSSILETAFKMPQDPKAVGYGKARLSTGFAIVAMKAVKSGHATDDAKQDAVFAEQVQNSEGLLEYELYKQSQIKQAKIKVAG